MSESDVKKKIGLGRGLSSLLGSSLRSEVESAGLKITTLPLELIKQNHNQPRKFFDQEKIIELAISIEKNGLLQPIVVSYDPTSQTYGIVAGERRYRAYRYLNKQDIECIIKEKEGDLETLKQALIENVQRENLSILEEGLSYKAIIESGVTHQQLADEIGKSRSHITNVIRVAKLPQKILDLISEDKISFGHAKVLLSADNPMVFYDIAAEGVSIKALEKAIQSQSSGEASEQEIKSYRKEFKEKPKTEDVSFEEEKERLYDILKDIYAPKKIYDKNKNSDVTEEQRAILEDNIKNLEQYIKDHFKVSLSLKLHANSESGSIVINYRNLEELEDIIDRIF